MAFICRRDVGFDELEKLQLKEANAAEHVLPEILKGECPFFFFHSPQGNKGVSYKKKSLFTQKVVTNAPTPSSA